MTSSSIHERYPVTGEIKIDFEKFPKEIIEDMMNAHRGSLPRMEIRIPKVYIQGGVTMAASFGEPTTIEFEFVALDIEIKES